MGYADRQRTVLAAMPGEVQGIADSLGLPLATVWRYVKHAHEHGLCYIVGWRRKDDGGPYVPRYAAGTADDAPCPFTPLTNKKRQVTKRAKARKQRAPDRPRWVDEFKPHRDPLTAAFFGQYDE